MGTKQGGVDPFKQIDELKERFNEARKKFRADVKERLGSERALRVDDVFYACRWKGKTYRALSPAELLEKLPKREPKKPEPEVAPASAA